MNKQIYKLEVFIPSLEDFSNKYPQYRNFAQLTGKDIFLKIMTPNSFINGMVSTTIGLPAVTGIAEFISEDISRFQGTPNFNYSKQYIGALMCSLMEANHYCKTGSKKSIQHRLFTRGEVYRKV